MRISQAPVLIADDGRTLGGAVAHGVGEAYLLQERLHLLIEGGTADDDFEELSAEGLLHLLADALAHLLRNDGHLQQQAHAWCLNLGEHLFAYDFLDDQRHGNDDAGLDVGEGLRNDGGRGHAVEIVDMASLDELIAELEGHAVHVCHGQDGDDAAAGLQVVAHGLAGEVEVRPQGAVGYHHTLGEACRTAGVVDEGQLVGALLVVVADVLLSEILGKLLAVELVEVLACIGQLVGA